MGWPADPPLVVKLIIEYDSSFKIARGTFYGVLDDELLLASYLRIGKIARAHKPDMAILDFSQVDSFLVSVAAISRLALSRPNIAEHYPRCIVAPGDVSYGMSRMFQALSEDKRKIFHVVRSMAEAYEVLGIIAEPDFQQVDTFEMPKPTGSKSKAANHE